jgi:hypothetical protein
MYKVVSTRGVTIRAFDSHFEATGYAVSYAGTSGQRVAMLSPDSVMKTSVVAEREGYGKVIVTIFGPAKDAQAYLTRPE